MQIYKNKPNKQIRFLASATEKYRAVTRAQETESVFQSIVIDILPISPYKGRNKKQKGALRLMEVGYKNVHHLELISRDNNYACTQLYARKPSVFHVRYKGRNSFSAGAWKSRPPDCSKSLRLPARKL